MDYSIIIAEFNPLSNGHKFLIEQTRQLYPEDKIIVIMSGNWVQRGEPAITDKFSRAESAIELGVDLVIELPTLFSISSAEDFAFGAIKIASSIKSAKRIVFGSECGDINMIKETAELFTTQNLDTQIKTKLAKGTSYASTIRQVFGENSILNSPNNLLGVEYLKAIKSQNSHLDAVTIKRNSSGYNDKNLSKFASSSALRAHLRENEVFNLSKYMPSEMFNRINLGNLPDTNPLYSLIVYKLHTLPLSEIEQTEGVCEGLEHRLFDQSKQSKNLDDFLCKTASKRYPIGKINRILLNLIFGTTKNMKRQAKARPLPIIILAVKNKEILSDSDFSCAIKQFQDYNNIPDEQKDIISINLLADKIYSSITHRTIMDTTTHKL